LNGTINGVSGVVNVDGVETPSSATGSVVTGAHGVFGSTTATCHESEVVIWPGYATTPAERSALLANQQQYWTPLPLDMFTQPSGAYGFRKLRSTYAGPAIRLRRASDNLETDVAFLGCTAFTGCPWDAAAAAAHCASTTCFGRTWYDQSGNARDLVQATPASQPQLIFNCNGGLPCFRSVGGELLASGGTITPATGNVAIGVVANRSAGTGTCSFLRENASNRIGAAGPANWTLAGSSGTITPTAADNAWHAANGNIAGASSVLNVDGAETAGTVTGSVAAGLVVLQGAASTTCSYAEGMFWDNYALTVNERTLLQQNQKNFWGTP
jgi:hypothetical protein